MPGNVGENVKFATTCGEVADAVTVLELAADCPALLTLSVTTYVPARAYKCVTVTPEPVPPSPKSQAKVHPGITVDDEAVKMTA